MLVFAVTAAVCLAGAAVVLTRLTSADAAAPSAEQPPPATAAVVRRDLVATGEMDAKLGYQGERKVAGRKAGTVTALPNPGAVIDRGASLYSVNEVGTPLFIGSVPLYRELAVGATEGADVRMVQENLRALGHHPGPIDAAFGKDTETAVKRWQRARKVEQTGRIAPGDIVVSPAAVRVSSVAVQIGAEAQTELMTVTDVTRVVHAELPQADQGKVAPGHKVQVRLSGDKVVAGTVTTVGDSAASDEQDDKGGAGSTKIPVTIALDDAAAVGPDDPVSATVTYEGARRTAVLAVPVRALLGLLEGGYAVDVVDGANRRFVKVELGLFADGFVEVRGDGLAEGMTVVTAA